MPISKFKNTGFLFLAITILFCFSCGSQNHEKKETVEVTKNSKSESVQILQPAIAKTNTYLPLLKGKKVAVVANPTSVLFETPSQPIHLVDLLLSNGITVAKVFAPEHGFRGTADAGEKVSDGIDTQTGLSIISLYGKNKKPTPQQMEGIEIMVFDIQDVGVRFYTYLSTLHYVMEACAEANIPLLVLDRPNPNGHYVDGPMMESKHFSFLGLHPVPLVYGMTIGEYAQMINGEGWLQQGETCDLTVIPMTNYTHNTIYSLPIKPSPNLPNDQAISLYPSLGLFEGTEVNAGRGTEMQFQIFGSPYLPEEKYPFFYVPQPNDGAKHPKMEGKTCNGIDLRTIPKMDQVDLTWLVNAYNDYGKKESFFNTKNFAAHAGNEALQLQIQNGMSAQKIRQSWQPDIEKFKKIREKYLLYN